MGKRDFDEVLTAEQLGDDGREAAYYPELDLLALGDDDDALDAADVAQPRGVEGDPNERADEGEPNGSEQALVPAAASRGLDLEQFLSTVDDSADVYKKPERVRAAKAGQWIGNPTQFIQGTYVAILASQGPFALLNHLLLEQKEATWTGAKGLDMTLTKFTVPTRSPAVAALHQSGLTMQEAPADLLFILDGRLDETWGNGRFWARRATLDVWLLK